MAEINSSKQNFKIQAGSSNDLGSKQQQERENDLLLFSSSKQEINYRSSEFSSDEEDPSRSPRLIKAQRKSNLTSVSKMDWNQADGNVDGVNIHSLSDEELRHHLISYGVEAGPIVESTRSVYERKLARLLRGQLEGDDTALRTKEYSDSEDEVEFKSPVVHNNRTETRNSHNKLSGSAAITAAKKVSAKESVSPSSFTSVTPRPSLRPNITYTLTDPEIVSSFRRRVSKAQDEVGQLASTVVEQVQEPLQPTRRSKYSLFIMIFLGVAVFFLGTLVYYNMEANSGQMIDTLPKLPDNKDN